jgi:hypothetical protein
MAVRRLAHRLGYRYRLHRKDRPGKPDLVFGPTRKVIFIHGCFWRWHERGAWPWPKAAIRDRSVKNKGSCGTNTSPTPFCDSLFNAISRSSALEISERINAIFSDAAAASTCGTTLVASDWLLASFKNPTLLTPEIASSPISSCLPGRVSNEAKIPVT